MWVTSLRTWLVCLVVTPYIHRLHAIDARVTPAPLRLHSFSYITSDMNMEVCFDKIKTEKVLDTTVNLECSTTDGSIHTSEISTKVNTSDNITCATFGTVPDTRNLILHCYVSVKDGSLDGTLAVGVMDIFMPNLDCANPSLLMGSSIMAMTCSTPLESTDLKIKIKNVEIPIIGSITSCINEKVTYIFTETPISDSIQSVLVYVCSTQLDTTRNDVLGCVSDTTMSGFDVVQVEGFKVNSANVIYNTALIGSEDKLTVGIEDDSTTTTHVDLLALIDKGTDIHIGSATDMTNPPECILEAYKDDRTKSINYVLVDYAQTKKVNSPFKFSSGSVPGHDFFGQYLSDSGPLESGWIIAPGTHEYRVATTLDTSAFITIMCDDGPNCYGYFDDKPDPAAQGATLSYGNTNDVAVTVHCSVTSLSAKSSKIGPINKVLVRWSPDGVTGKMSVCADFRDMDESHLMQYQLLLVDGHGKVLRSENALYAFNEEMCFTDILVDTRIFDVTDKVTIISTKRDSYGYTVLGGSQTEVFLIGTKVESVGARSLRVSWANPGGHTFTVKRQPYTAPLKTNLTCHTCAYYLDHTTKMDGAVLVEVEDTPVKIAAIIPLDETTTSGMEDTF